MCRLTAAILSRTSFTSLSSERPADVVIVTSAARPSRSFLVWSLRE